MARRRPGHEPDPRQLKEKLRRVATQRSRPEPKLTTEQYAFVAYPHVDEDIALRLVDALKQRGICVKWDKDLLGGDNFRSRLDSLLEGAAAVIVIWSENVTDFVIDEADAGKARGTLVTCRVPGLVPAKVPTGFRGLHCIDVDDVDAILRALERRGLIAMPAS
jgi:hypothetical protein